MAHLLDLPPEVLALILAHFHDENRSLESVSLTGNRALTAIAQNLILRDLRICLDLPISSAHRFYPAFRRICNTPALRNAVRSVTFKCRSGFHDLDFVDLLRKYLAKLQSVTRVHIQCSAHAKNLSGLALLYRGYRVCMTPTLLISVLRLPALRILVINDCIVNHHIIPDLLRSHSLRMLVLNASGSSVSSWQSFQSLLDYMPAVTVIEMRETDPSEYEPSGDQSCLSDVLKRIVPRALNDLGTCLPRKLHLICDCQSAHCHFRDIIARVSTALQSFKLLEQLILVKVLEWESDTLDAARYAYTELSLHGEGVLKRLSLRLGLKSYGSETPFICEALLRLSNLEAVALECDGTDLGVLDCIAAHPSIRCVYFYVAPPADLDIEDLARGIAKQAPRLTLVAWVPAEKTAQIREDHTIEMKVYAEPKWLQFGGTDTKWWDEG